MLSGLKHFRFCRRRWALVHLEQQWSENVFTMEGHFMHERVHDERFTELRGSVLLSRGMPIRSETLKITGECDMVELHRDEKGNEISGALESVGLDPAVGYLHTLRPGRSSLALDMLEELRAPLADRFVLFQINLGKVTDKDFSAKENGAVFLKDDARKAFLSAWQKRKQETLTHPYLKENIPWGLVPYAQVMLLARFIRGDLDAYPPFMWK